MSEVQRSTPNKRHIGSKKRDGKAKKKQKMMPHKEKKVRIDKKMKKLFQKRAREYNSDDEEEDDKAAADVVKESRETSFYGNEDEFEDEEGDVGEKNDESEDEGGELQPGITKFMEGCKAFKIAFKKILKKTAADDVLGPVLSAHKKLVAEKLAEEESERKVKGDAKKDKHVIGKKGHVMPANYLDAHEKFLIGVATKGVVKLFNAVNKAQHAQRGLNPSRTRDEKIIKKRKKEAFFSELGKSSSQSEKDGPVWAPLRDNYMLTNQKLKDWDKQQDTATGDDFSMPASDSSSEDE